MNISEVVAHPQAITWQPWAVQYFFFIGIGACAALLACVARLVSHTASNRVERACLFIALTCSITAPLALTADLHQTARFWHFYAWPTPWSWMPWGALLLPLFMGLLGLWFFLFHLHTLTGRHTPLMRWLALATGLTAAGLLLYTGREVSVVRAVPVWFSYWYPVVMLLSAMGALLAMLKLPLRDTPWLAKGQVVVLALLGAVALAWYRGDAVSGEALRQQWHLAGGIRLCMQVSIALWGLALGVALYACARPLTGVLVWGNVLISAGLCWILRWSLLMGGQTIPKYNALINDYHLPAGNEGAMAIVGTFGLWFALMITLGECVNWFLRRVRHG